MGKNKPKGSGGAKPTTKPSKAPSSISRGYTIVGTVVAILAQVALGYLGINGYFSSSTPAESAPSQEKVATAPPAALPECPTGWPECPRIAGLQWEEIFELQRSAAAAAAAAVPPSEALTGCDAPSLLSPQRVPGMHLLCVLAAPEGEAGRVAATIAAYPDMRGGGAPPTVALVPKGLRTTDQLLITLYRSLGLTRKRGAYQPPALFSAAGVRIKSLKGGLAQGRLLLMEGGQWLWPPVDVGHVHELDGLIEGQTTRVVTVSLKPLVVSVENFLSSGENEHIIARAKPHMEKSGVALKDADKGKAAKEFRTSSQYFLPTVNDAQLEAIDRRVMMLTRIPISHAEYIQVLRYDHMEHYSAHHDYFDPAAYASNPEMLASVEHGAKNRLATVFFYLNNVSSGGQTNFPRAQTAEFPHGGPQPRDYFDCSKGLSVYPQEGKVIIFYSMLPNGEMDDFSLHGGCDVLDPQATKWSANFWLWNKPYHFLSKARKKATDELKAQYL